MTWFITSSDAENLNDVFNKSEKSVYNRYRVYLQGAEKFYQEIDLIHYTKSLRLLKTLLSSLMDDNERFMSVYQYQNSLKLKSCELCHEKQDNDRKMPKLVANEFEVDYHVIQIEKFFNSYLEEKFSAKDYRLLKGVFWSEDLKNDELNILMPDKNNSEEFSQNSLPSIENIPNNRDRVWFDKKLIRHKRG